MIKHNTKLNRIKTLKGQSAMESIILIGFVMLLTIPILMIFFNVDRTSSALAQARASVQIMADNVNKVYAQGQGAQIITTIAVPQYCKNVTLKSTGAGGEIIFVMHTRDGDVEVYQKTFAPVEDSELFTFRRHPGDEYMVSGLQKIKISLVDSGGGKVVSIEPY
ncbi:hypothetical protein J7J90_02175 [Candidatus Micrarchaeota archaeon]|nr:hypothetical protein [Candidatus Micrarchaeota archaeon]